MRNGIVGRVCVHMIAMMAWIAGAGVAAQTVGDEAEMERLQSRAEESIANGDADGAAMSSGKAALMASQLAARQQNQADIRFYRGAEALFRAQEHAYRALALFQRAGGQPPASSGVCGTMRLARHSLREAMELLADQSPASVESGRSEQAHRLYASAETWGKTIDGLNGDFQCRE
ncbi:MAG: hypothetical protein ACREIK_00885 [Nitrospiraceae bacterium]